LKSCASRRDPALCGSCKCSPIPESVALSKTPHALADGLMLVFQHPVFKNKRGHYMHGRIRIQDRSSHRGHLPSGRVGFQSRSEGLNPKEFRQTADIKTEGALPLQKGVVWSLKTHPPRQTDPIATTHSPKENFL
jgi:hypothetical protein